MSAMHTTRQIIIDENLPQLVSLLTGFNKDDENFKLCEKYAFSRIASHRFLSVNSHEVRRRVDGISERFMAGNYTQHGERLKELVQEFVTDPLCTGHYELDVQWSILSFLLDVSKNPVAALSENKNSIRIDDIAHGLDDSLQRRQSTAMDDLVNSLIKHNISIGRDRPRPADDSDLSDWSDDGDDGIADMSTSLETSNGSTRSSVMPLKLIPFARDALRPPERKSIFTDFDASNALAWREQNVQTSWWANPTADEEVAVVTEWCLQREIIWMLQMQPINSDIDAESLKKFSKFFSLNITTDEFVVNENVTIASVSVNGIKSILIDLASAATKLYRFRKFFKEVFEPPIVNSFLDAAQNAPYTIQNYANGIKDFVRIITHKLYQLEMDLIEQDISQTYTVIYIHNELLPLFRKINILHDIHMKVYIDFKTNEGHVCTGYLFSGLITEMDTASTTERLNIAASLLLVSIRYYLHVFNRWWIEGQFKDWCNEFPIEKCIKQLRDSSSSKIYKRRSITAGVSRSLDAASIKQRIDACEIFTLICEEALEAGYILNILYNLDKLSELEDQQSMDESHDLEEVFLKSFWEEINKFHVEELSDRVNVEEGSEMAVGVVIKEPGREEDQMVPNLMGEMDALLSMCFEQYITDAPVVNEVPALNEDANNCHRLYEKICEVTKFPLPLSIVIHGCLKKMLKSRISTANKYVLRIFLDEYKVLDHLLNLQRVFFFGAGDLMLTFYSNLFKSMNSGEDWNNSYLLTVQLDDVLSIRYPSMHSLFSVQVTAADSHIKETLSAIMDITINYSVRDSIRDVIHERSLIKYNEVFRFLLQVKWAIWTLETLQFPIAFKKRQPYHQLTLIDLIFKRLALVRNWIIYSVQCVHSHLMTFVIQSMGQQLVKRMKKVECLREIIQLHDHYIDTIYQHCFRRTSDAAVKNSFEQLLSLVVVLRDEWNNLQNVNSFGDFVDGEDQFDVQATVQQVDTIESTYINCHCNIAEILTREVYKKDKETLASLSAAFNCSCPY